MNNDVKFIRKNGRIIPIGKHNEQDKRKIAFQIMKSTAKRDMEMSKTGKKLGAGFGIIGAMGLAVGLLKKSPKAAMAGLGAGLLGSLVAGGAEGREMSGKARQKYSKMFKKGKIRKLDGVTGAEAMAWEDVKHLKGASNKNLHYFHKKTSQGY